jgi:hypothetical protein
MHINTITIISTVHAGNDSTIARSGQVTLNIPSHVKDPRNREQTKVTIEM